MGLRNVLLNCNTENVSLEKAQIMVEFHNIVKVKDIPLKDAINVHVIGNIRKKIDGKMHKVVVVQTTLGKLEYLNYYVSTKETVKKYGRIIDDDYIVDAYIINKKLTPKLKKYNIL